MVTSNFSPHATQKWIRPNEDREREVAAGGRTLPQPLRARLPCGIHIGPLTHSLLQPPRLDHLPAARVRARGVCGGRDVSEASLATCGFRGAMHCGIQQKP